MSYSNSNADLICKRYLALKAELKDPTMSRYCESKADYVRKCRTIDIAVQIDHSLEDWFYALVQGHEDAIIFTPVIYDKIRLSQFEKGRGIAENKIFVTTDIVRLIQLDKRVSIFNSQFAGTPRVVINNADEIFRIINEETLYDLIYRMIGENCIVVLIH